MPEPAPHYGIPMHTAHSAIAITALGAAIAIAFCLWRAIRSRNPLAVYLLIAGGLTVFALEPFTDVLGAAVFPERHQIGWIHALGRHIPAYIGLIYIFYFAPAWLFVTHRFQHGITRRGYSLICGALIVSACLIELIPIHYKLWTYYGSQPMRIGGFPVWWAFVNGHSLIASSLVLYLLLTILPKNRQFLLIAIMPAVVLAVHTFGSMLGYLTVGSTSATAPTFATYAGTIGAIAFITTMLWIYWRALVLHRRVTGRPAAPALDPEPAHDQRHAVAPLSAVASSAG